MSSCQMLMILSQMMNERSMVSSNYIFSIAGYNLSMVDHYVSPLGFEVLKRTSIETTNDYLCQYTRICNPISLWSWGNYAGEYYFTSDNTCRTDSYSIGTHKNGYSMYLFKLNVYLILVLFVLQEYSIEKCQELVRIKCPLNNLQLRWSLFWIALVTY